MITSKADTFLQYSTQHHVFRRENSFRRDVSTEPYERVYCFGK